MGDALSPHRKSPLPAWAHEIRPHQQVAVDEIMDAYTRESVVFLDAPTGCLHGDMELTVNRAGKGFRLPIRDFVHKFNGGESTIGRGRTRTIKWDPNITSCVAYSDGNHIRKMEVARAFSTGVKECWKLTTTDGRSLTGSAEHPLFEREGGWTELLHLEAGMQVAISGGRGGRGGRARPKRRDPYRANLIHHPYAGSRGTADPHSGYKVVLYRLVFEANHNGLELGEFLRRCRTGEIDGLFFLPPSLDVHHIDHDHTNNHPSNLMTLTRAEHLAHHADERTVLFRQDWAEVESIEPVGEHETFDLTMVDAPHSYIANGFVVHNSGKTLIAELVRRRLDTRGLYVCSDKSLQDQAAKDFPYAKVLKGKANYQTLFGRGSITAEDCNSTSADSPCTWCDPKWKCPYRIAKAAAAVTEELAIVNTSYLLAEANTARPIVTAKQPFIIADEADQLEGAILGYIGFEVPMYVFRDLRLDAPPKAVRKPRIIAWLQQLASDATEYVRTHELELKRRKRWGILVADTMQLIDELNHDIVRQKALTDDDPMADDSGRWIRDYNTKTFKMVPVQVGTYGPKKLWRHGKKWLIMSATLISPDVMATELGLPFEYEVVSVPMTFAVENRPVYLAGVANMTYRAEDVEHERMADAICAIIDRHPGERILVHTVSFRNTERLHSLLTQRRLDRRIWAYTDGREKMDTLARYRATPGSIMLAASMARGVDLRDDDCRVVVIAKVPFPNLSDPRTSARLHLPGGQQWYTIQTIRDVVQMTGRGVRSETDYAASYILDKQFVGNVWRKNKSLFPGWWREAVDNTFDPRRLMITAG